MDTQSKFSDADRLFKLAEQCAGLNKSVGTTATKSIISALNNAVSRIDSAYAKIDARFSTSADIPSACQWLLDNRYLAVREATDASRAFAAEKRLRCSENGIVILELAKCLVNATGGKISEDRCRIFLSGWQSASVLPRRELCLFAEALRAALIFSLSDKCAELLASSSPEGLTDGFCDIFTSLRLISELDMGALIESVDIAESYLMADPAGVYPDMDEASRAYYRDRLSELARANSMEEHALAKHILKLCNQSEGDARHIGYYLFAKPLGKEKKERRGGLYIAANVLFTAFISLLCGFLSHSVAAALLLLLPVSELTKNLLDYIILLCVKPRRLPVLEMKKGVPEDAKTVCVISALLTGKDSAEVLARRLEEFSLLNRRGGKNLMYGILADLPEADTAVTDADDTLISSAISAVNALNEKYGSGFYLFTRPRTEDTGRGKFCGYERKRGAVLALARLLRGEKSELSVSAGKASRLKGAKYIISLDSDTNPTPDSLCELIGAISHPLNRPRLDRENACVVSGHGIIHPRMSYELKSAQATDFSRFFTGVGGTEPYSSLCGELYNDLFERSGFSGKGIIDAEALIVCSDAHIPDGLVLSHDALEGAYLRGGYLSNTEFTDSFPTSPVPYYRRTHRWTRGDWQNSPWIFSRGRTLPDIERFKLFDSLRRSLVAPASFLAILLGLIYSGHALMLAAFTALLALAARLLIALTEYGTLKRADTQIKYHSRLIKGVCAAFVQTALRLLFLPYEAWICLSTAICSLWRMLISGKRLLEWETAAQSELKKRNLISYFLNMWAAPLTGQLLVVMSTNIFAKAVGVLWVFAPLSALVLTLPSKAERGISDNNREYLLSCAADIWGYFKTFCTAEDNYLPPDNYQEQPPVGTAHRTSPTNIGLALVSALCALDLGIAEKSEAVTLIERMLSSVERLSKYKGHLMNWYDTRTLRPLEPEYVSTVDSGNIYACLITLKNGLTELGCTELAERVRILTEPMDFSVLFDKRRRLFYTGIDLNKGKPSKSYYDLMASEARLTSYLAVAKGDVPREHWRRLSRAMRSYRGYQGMASWTGTMFEYLMPELFLPLANDSLQYETAKYCLFVQRHRQSPSKVWGISESAFFSLDSALNYRYKAHGCAQLALKRGQNRELVISPYSSFLALKLEPDAACVNLRRLEKLGAKGQYGFIEAVDFTPSRCRNSTGEAVRCYMAHHLGMSMLAIANCLREDITVRRFTAEPAMNAYRCLLEEKLPQGAAVLRLNEGGYEKQPRQTGRKWAKRGTAVDFEKPCCCVLSNGRYNIMLTESGISRATCGDMLVYKSPFLQLGEGHGTEMYIKQSEVHTSLLPEPNRADGFMWEMSELSCSFSFENDLFEAKTVIAAAGSECGEIRITELHAKADIESAKMIISFEPVLAGFDDYVNHPAYWRLGLDSKADGNCLMLHRLPRGRQNELWLCLACDKTALFSADRDGGTGHLSAPLVTVKSPFSLKAGEHFSIRLALCVGDSAEGAFIGAQRMLAMGVSEFGSMPSACAVMLQMSTAELDLAMSMIGSLWFEKAEKPFVSKQKLWQYGISGDMPIIFCPIDKSDSETVQSVTKQFCLLRACGVYADLVFLCDEGGEYSRPVYGAVRDTLAIHGLEEILGVHGGVWILPSEAEEVITHCASYIIGSTPTERKTDTRFILPALTPRSMDTIPKSNYGSDNCFSFYVNHSLPPRFWSNMLTNGSFGYFACDCGMGNMWYKNARMMRINRLINEPYSVQGPESVEYINSNGRFSIFAASDGLDCRVRFGFGYASWEKSFGNTGIKCTAFVPCGIDARVFIIELFGNITGQIAWKTELLLSDNDNDYTAVKCDYVNSYFTASSERSAFSNLIFKAGFSHSPEAWTCDLLSWLKGDFDEKTECLAYPIFGALISCQKVNVIVCGCCEDDKLDYLCKPENTFIELEKTQIAWLNSMQKLHFVGSAPFEHYVNGWAPYQAIACRIMGRCSLYQSGGATGFRDQLQDAVNMLLLSPKLAREQILTCCEHQYAEGDVMHWWHTLPDGDRGVRTRCSDDLLWLVWALCEYVEKTGDAEICSELVCYVNSPVLSDAERDRYETPSRSDDLTTVLEHARRAVDCCYNRGTGAHGLLLFGTGDWNDGMDNIGGESVWLSFFFAHTVRRFADLLSMLCKQNVEHYRALAASVGTAADSAFDGSRYLRGYWRDGTAIGLGECAACRTDSIAQSWAAFCPDASNSRIDTAIDTALAELYDRENGLIKLFDPPFDADDRDPGYIRSYGPGFRENGGQYTHAAIWLAIACIKRGRANDGYRILCDLLPCSHDLKRYMAEPFVLPADVYTCTEHNGQAGWTWYTGSAGWYYRAVFEELLGLKLWSGALYIRPCLPDGFPEYRIKWTDKEGKEHDISVSAGEIMLDGEKYDGKGIPYN